MIKIGIDCHNLEKERTGVGRYISNLLKEWGKSETRNNFNFILYFHKQIPKDEFLQNPIFEKKLLKIHWLKSSFLIYFLFLLPLALKKDRVDLAFFPCYMVPITYFGKSIIVLHDIIFKVYPNLFSWRYKIPYLLFSWWGVKTSKAIITVSEFSKSEIIKYYKADSNKVFVTPLGVEEKLKMEAHNKESLDKKKYGIRKDFVLCLGQIFNRRYVDKTILAFEKIAVKFLDLQLLIIGKNRTNPFIDIKKMIIDTNAKLCREAILQKDYALEKDLASLYREAKLTVYLSDYEGFGLPPLEAMALKTPVLTTDKSALKETVGEATLVVNDPNNIDEITEKMENGIADENLRQKLIEGGIKQAEKFSWQKCAKQTMEIFLRKTQ